jgi:hypothetical protein
VVINCAICWRGGEHWSLGGGGGGGDLTRFLSNMKNCRWFVFTVDRLCMNIKDVSFRNHNELTWRKVKSNGVLELRPTLQGESVVTKGM